MLAIHARWYTFLPPQWSTIPPPLTHFSSVLSRYLFDQRLRSHLLEAFSFIEVSIRTQWARQLSYGSRHGEYAHLDAALFGQYHAQNLKELERNYRRIANQQVTDFQKLPIWDVIHAMSFGQLSKWYSSLGISLRTFVSENAQFSRVNNPNSAAS